MLRKLLLQPEELIGHWDMDSFQEIVQDVPGGRSSFGQDILFEDSMWATALSYGSENHMFQDIRVYARAENAIAIFDEEYPAERHVEASETPGDLQFQPASQRYIQGCKLIALNTYQCLFKVQQGPYITSIKVPVDGVAVTLQDWEEMSRLIEGKLLAQVQGVD